MEDVIENPETPLRPDHPQNVEPSKYQMTQQQILMREAQQYMDAFYTFGTITFNKRLIMGYNRRVEPTGEFVIELYVKDMPPLGLIFKDETLRNKEVERAHNAMIANLLAHANPVYYNDLKELLETSAKEGIHNPMAKYDIPAPTVSLGDPEAPQDTPTE